MSYKNKMKFNFLSLCLILLSLPLFSENTYILFDKKFMDAEWNFLPDVPASFDENSSEAIEIGYSYKKLKTNIFQNKINLSLNRNSEPKDVNLDTKKEGFMIGYTLDEDNLIYFFNSIQKANPQVFSCYEFSGIILGGCENASFSITSSNDKYQQLGSNIISIKGEADTYGVGFKKYWNNFWIYSTKFEFQETGYNYDWLSPIEDIKSPFLLSLVINGNILGDAIDLALRKLPQTDEWVSQQINLGLKQKFISTYNFNVIAEYDLVLLNFKNYHQLYKTPKVNFKLRAGIEFYAKNLSLLLYGDIYKNNLIGFEPITFNQRTEHYFDKPYGEIGISLKYNF